MAIKLGLLFLTRNDVHHPNIWKNFVCDAAENIRIFSHPKYALANGAFLSGTQVLNRCTTAWGDVSLVRAMLSLLNEAFVDHRISHFCFLSESCLPIRSWQFIQNSLQADSRSWIHSYNVEEMASFHAARMPTNLGICSSDWRVHSQWALLNREAAENLLAHDITSLFEKVFAADEHYIGTVLAIRGFEQSKIKKQDVTWVKWQNGTPANINLEDISTVTELQKFGGFFARKFMPDTDVSNLSICA